MIMQNHKLGLSMVASVFSGGGLGGAGFSEMTKIGSCWHVSKCGKFMVT